MDVGLQRGLSELRAAELGSGVHVKDAPLRMALVYPSEYRVAMSSLGYLQVHRLANARPGTSCERAMLPDRESIEAHFRTRTPLLSIERQRPVGELDLIGISHAYELELTGLVQVLRLSGLEPLAEDRSALDPLVVIGGPITFSNPLPTSPFADVMILGEAEVAFEQLLDRLEERPEAARGSETARRALLEELAGLPGFFIPALHGDRIPAIARAPDHRLPAYSAIRTPNTELHDMVLVEPTRGCSRGCTFCVMRRTTNGGMRTVTAAEILEHVPADAQRVGLVGAAVSDHPRIKEILGELVDGAGKKVGISSLRANRLDDELVGLLARGGYRSMTIGLDAASARLRDEVEKGLKDEHVVHATELARAHGMRHLKLYVVLGLPGETEEDIDELVSFAQSLSSILPVKLGLSPFVPKLHTPLALAPFIGEKPAGQLLKSLKKKLGRHVEVRGPGAKEAYVEYRLAQGGPEHGRAAVAVVDAGGGLGAWKRALAELPDRHRPPNLLSLVPPPTRRRAGSSSPSETAQAR